MGDEKYGERGGGLPGRGGRGGLPPFGPGEPGEPGGNGRDGAVVLVLQPVDDPAVEQRPQETFDPELVRALLRAATPASTMAELYSTTMGDWCLKVIEAADAVRASERKPRS